MTTRKGRSSAQRRQGWAGRLWGWLWPVSDHNRLRRVRRHRKAGKGKAAYRLLKKMAGRGNAEAQYQLGTMYEHGEGRLANAADAIGWYEKAARQGHGPAQERLAVIYAGGCNKPLGMREDDPIIAALFPAGITMAAEPEKSLHWAQAAAEQDMPMACALLGNHYAHGTAEPDYKLAEHWYRKAASLGNAQGQLGLGTLLAGGYLGTSDYAEARKWFIKAAEQRLGTAWYYLGEIYRRGLGCEPSDKAVSCYLQGANLGSAAAQRLLGFCYLNGVGVDRHVGHAETWLRKAALQGDVLAINMLGDMNCQDIAGQGRNYYEAASWYRKAADFGNPEAQHALSQLYKAGLGVVADPLEAHKWCRRAAEQGLVAAQLDLASYLINGIGVAPSRSEALKWLRAAADQGHVEALNGIARLHILGIDGPPDWRSAVRYFIQAAEAGDAEAQLRLCTIHATPEGDIPQDYAEAMRWGLMAAEQGVVPAILNVGRFYMQGLGVPRSDADAEYWLGKLADQDPRAMTALGELHAVYGDRRDLERARAYLLRARELGDPRADLMLAELGLMAEETIELDMGEAT